MSRRFAGALALLLLSACFSGDADPEVSWYCESQCEGSPTRDCYDTCLLRECQNKCASAPTRQCTAECVGDTTASCSAMFPGLE